MVFRAKLTHIRVDHTEVLLQGVKMECKNNIFFPLYKQAAYVHIL